MTIKQTRGNRVFFCNTCTVEVEGAFLGPHSRDRHDIDLQYPDKWAGMQLFKLLTTRVNPKLIAQGMRTEMKRTHDATPQAEQIITAMHRLLEQSQARLALRER